MSFLFLSNTKIYQKLAHISLCMTEFIGRTMSLHVSAHGAIIRRYINKPYTIELCLIYESIYCIYRCVTITGKYGVLLSLPLIRLYAQIKWLCFYTALKTVLNKYLKFIKIRKVSKYILKC
jgi:hypothetical protein